jgi:putative ABC transport system permease protein
VTGLRELWRRKFQFLLITLVVALISYLVLMINGLGIGLNRQAGSALLALDADAIAYAADSDLSVIRSELSPAVLQELAARESVTDVAPLGYAGVNTRHGDVDITPAALLGIVPGTIAEPDVLGRPLTADDRRGILADRQFLRDSGLSVGDSVIVPSRLLDFEFTIIGEVDEGFFFFQPVVYLLLDSWREVKYGDDPDAPAASVALLQGDDLSGIEARRYEVVSKEVAFDNIEGVEGQQATVMALRFFGYVISALVIGIFFYVLTLQKIVNIGLLKALGASTPYIFRQLLMQVLIVTLLGTGVAVPLAYVTEFGLGRLRNSVPVDFNPDTFLFTAIIVVFTGVVGALFSARQMVKVDPVIALGHQE